MKFGIVIAPGFRCAVNRAFDRGEDLFLYYDEQGNGMYANQKGSLQNVTGLTGNVVGKMPDSACAFYKSPGNSFGFRIQEQPLKAVMR